MKPYLIGAAAAFAALILFFEKAKCKDGWESHSIGVRGACSHHGGVESGGRVFLAALLVGAAVTFIAKNWRATFSRWIEHKEGAEKARKVRRFDAARPKSICPLCGAPMRGSIDKTGTLFLMCTKFPSCKGFANLEEKG